MRVVYYPFNTNTRLALDSSRSNALSISKRHAEEWWFNFGGEVGGLFSSRKNFFSQTLNPKRKRKISQKLNCNFQTHTHRNALKRFSYNTCAKRNTRISRSKRTEEYFLSLFFFGVLLILDTNFASLARAFSALFGIERIYGPCPHSTLLQK